MKNSVVLVVGYLVSFDQISSNVKQYWNEKARETGYEP